jgi:hypothetical protein
MLCLISIFKPQFVLTNLKCLNYHHQQKKRKLDNLLPLGHHVVKKFFPDCPSTTHTITNIPVTKPMVEVKEKTVASPSGNFTITESVTRDDLYYKTEPRKPALVSKGIQVTVRKKFRSTAVNTHVTTKNVSTQVPKCVKTVIKANISRELSSEFGQRSSDDSAGSDISEVDIQLYCKLHLKLIAKNSRSYLGLPQDSLFIVKLLEEALPMRYEYILIVLKKIRLHDTNERLSHDFGITESYVGKIFNNYVPLLASYFKKLIFWPSAQHIEEMLPIPFRYRYRRVQSIVDCLEMELQIPTNAVHQALTYSNYKNCNTVKYMLSATPHGVITFISTGFGGIGNIISLGSYVISW